MNPILAEIDQIKKLRIMQSYNNKGLQRAIEKLMKIYTESK